MRKYCQILDLLEKITIIASSFINDKLYLRQTRKLCVLFKLKINACK